jgi:tetratricopeptide (TPR) repeat protein
MNILLFFYMGLIVEDTEIYKNAIKYINDQEFEKAENLFKSLREQKDAPYNDYPNIYRWLGVIYFERENYEKAEGYYLDAQAKLKSGKKFSEFQLKADEDKNALAVLNHDIGLIFAERRRYLEAERLLKRALNQIEDRSDVVLSCILNDLGYLYYIWQKYCESIEQYDKAITKDPTNGYANIYRGTAIYRKGDLDRAEESFNSALIIFKAKISSENDQNSADYKLAEATIKNNLARIYVDKEHYVEAEAEIKDALKIYDNQSKYIESCTTRRKKIEKNLKTALLINYGILYYKQDKNDKAKEQFKAAVDHSIIAESPSYRAYYNLANTYAKDNETKTAEKYYKEALKINPEGKEAKEAIENLSARKEKINWWDWWFKPATGKFTIPRLNWPLPTVKCFIGAILLLMLLSLILSIVAPSWTLALNETNTKYIEQNVEKYDLTR